MTTTTSARRRAAGTVAAALLLPALLAACSSTGQDPDAAATSSGTGGAELAACLREKGYDVDDPSGSSAQLGVPAGADQEQWLRDLAACSPDSGDAGGAGAAKPAPATKGLDQAIGACVRDRGFADFPDDAREQAEYQPSGDRSVLDEAVANCEEHALDEAGVRR